MIGHQVKIIAPNINAKFVSEKNVHFFGRSRSVNLGGTKIDVNIALGEEKKALKSFLKQENFDVIHYHTIWNPLLPFQIRRYSKTKQIATFHDTPSNLFVGRWIMPLVARWVFAFLDGIISVSKTQCSFISRFSKRSIQIIPNGIDLDEIQTIAPKGGDRKDDNFQMFFLGRLEPRKGVMHAVKAFHQLKQRYPKLKLIIAGDGDGRAEVEQYIADCQLIDIELKGFVDEATKYQLLKESDLYLAPALFGESFGIVLLESMAVGTAMAGYANEGYKNVLTESMMDGFAAPGDLNEFINSIERLIPSEKRDSLSKHGLQEVKKYDWKEVSKAIEQVYLK